MPKPLGQPGEQRNERAGRPRDFRGDETRGARLCCPGAGRATRPRALRCASSARHRGLRPRVERLRRVRTRASGERGARTARSRARGSPSRKFQGDATASRARASRCRRRRRGRDGERGAHRSRRRSTECSATRRCARARDATRPTLAGSAPPFSPILRPTLHVAPLADPALDAGRHARPDAAGKTTILYKLTSARSSAPSPPSVRQIPTPRAGRRHAQISRSRARVRAPPRPPPRRRPRLTPVRAPPPSFVGFNVEKVQYKNVMFTVWDVGGQEKLRPLATLFQQHRRSHYVADSLDKDRMIARRTSSTASSMTRSCATAPSWCSRTSRT